MSCYCLIDGMLLTSKYGNLVSCVRVEEWLHEIKRNGECFRSFHKNNSLASLRIVDLKHCQKLSV